jgi:hypothetical protein
MISIDSDIAILSEKLFSRQSLVGSRLINLLRPNLIRSPPAECPLPTDDC